MNSRINYTTKEQSVEHTSEFRIAVSEIKFVSKNNDTEHKFFECTKIKFGSIKML
jgi:hypothetical protein